MMPDTGSEIVLARELLFHRIGRRSNGMDRRAQRQGVGLRRDLHGKDDAELVPGRLGQPGTEDDGAVAIEEPVGEIGRQRPLRPVGNDQT